MATQPASGTSRAKLVGDGDTFEVNGRKFKLTIHPEEGMGPPWEENDCHGIVSDWTTRAKTPGERVLSSDRSHKRYYDFQASMQIARTKWGFTDGAKAAEAVEADFERLRRWCNDQWSWVYIKVEWLGTESYETLGGMESDCAENISEEAHNLAEQLLTMVPKPTYDTLVEILRDAVQTEEGNWDSPEEEPCWLSRARQALVGVGEGRA